MSVCRYIQAQQGDGCWSLANRCAITQADLVRFNPASGFCDHVRLDDYVCCSTGSKPDFSPKPAPDGSCFAYTAQAGDTCLAIANGHKIDDWNKINDWNHNTWGWAGCNKLTVGARFCLSTGDPPFPDSIKNAVCGPQVPGTQRPKGWSSRDWVNLNLCPLNACCDIWGQCGISAEFCTWSLADTWAPGTAASGSNGCISNCGTDFANNKDKPAQLRHVAYFEAWNEERPCLTMDISQIDTSQYNYIHFAFGDLTTDWRVDVSKVQSQFSGLLAMKGVKRVLSFGGWSFSTDQRTVNIFRSGVLPANAKVFARNVVDFIIFVGLDGVDFDWEYPAEQDMPPADNPYSGIFYLEFLKLVRQMLPPEKTLSIAAPASYWYLKGFPIKEIAAVVDYIVYMTYDLHGQWDYKNAWTDPGCPKGDCLRHHTNITEVRDTLAMITKAGVPAKQIVVGMPRYGRSFKMAMPLCSNQDCHYTGPESGAAKGRCTDTAGYISNAEIREIIATNPSVIQYYDTGDILIYNDTEWVSWMKPSTYAYVRSWVEGANFGGTSDWAVDLDYVLDAPDYDDDDGGSYDDCDYETSYPTLDALSAASGGMRADCVDGHTMSTLVNVLDATYDNYTEINKGYDDLFHFYVEYIKNLVPDTLNNTFMFDKKQGLLHDVDDTPFPNGPGMAFFDCAGGADGQLKFPCSDLPKYYDQTKSHTTTMTLTRKEDYEKALGDAGLDASWVTFGIGKVTTSWTDDAKNPHTFHSTWTFAGFPVQNSSMVVSNPKDIITKGLGNIDDLHADMIATELELKLGLWEGGDSQSPPSVYGMPVSMLMSAVDAMAQAKKIAAQQKQKDDAEAEAQKSFIMLLVTVFLMVIPFVGEELALAEGLVTISRAIAIAGEAGNAAFTVYQAVTNKEAGVGDILGLLFGVGSVAKAARTGRGLDDVAKARSAMKAEDFSKIGKIFKDNDDRVQGILKTCRW